MSTDVYEKLAQHLDNLPAGYPGSDSGVELRILRRLFTPEEAHLAVHLTLIPETAPVIGHRAGIPTRKAMQLLQDMEQKGLVFSYHEEGTMPKYQATGFVIGIYEFQLNRLHSQIVQDFEEYAPTWFNLDLWQKAPQLRTIPVGESIQVQREAMPYEQAERIVQSVKKIAVAPCICRKAKKILGEGCNKLSEACLTFDKAAEYYIRNGLGKKITVREALQILKSANDCGLVLQPGNSEKPMSICACCGCCCGVLLNIKRHPGPASIVASPFIACLDSAACDGCGMCETRCQMEAIDLHNGFAALNVDRCIGCGLCVSTCPTGALQLKRKPENEQPRIPKNSVDAYVKLGKARGKLKNRELVGMVIKSMIDRLRAIKRN